MTNILLQHLSPLIHNQRPVNIAMRRKTYAIQEVATKHNVSIPDNWLRDLEENPKFATKDISFDTFTEACNQCQNREDFFEEVAKQPPIDLKCRLKNHMLWNHINYKRVSCESAIALYAHHKNYDALFTKIFQHDPVKMIYELEGALVVFMSNPDNNLLSDLFNIIYEDIDKNDKRAKDTLIHVMEKYLTINMQKKWYTRSYDIQQYLHSMMFALGPAMGNEVENAVKIGVAAGIAFKVVFAHVNQIETIWKRMHIVLSFVGSLGCFHALSSTLLDLLTETVENKKIYFWLQFSLSLCIGLMSFIIKTIFWYLNMKRHLFDTYTYWRKSIVKNHHDNLNLPLLLANLDALIGEGLSTKTG